MSGVLNRLPTIAATIMVVLVLLDVFHASDEVIYILLWWTWANTAEARS